MLNFEKIKYYLKKLKEYNERNEINETNNPIFCKTTSTFLNINSTSKYYAENKPRLSVFIFIILIPPQICLIFIPFFFIHYLILINFNPFIQLLIELIILGLFTVLSGILAYILMGLILKTLNKIEQYLSNLRQGE